jgi:hypothetical protein
MDFILFIVHEVFFWSIVIVVAALPFAVFQRTRIITAVVWMWLSFIFGGCLWVGSLTTTYQLAGLFWTIFGVITVVGVVPIAFIASIFSGYWEGLLQLFVALVLTFGLRILAGLIFAGAEPKPDD